MLHPLCNAMFRCGCAPAWAGAAEHCNIRAAAGPHCPWCAHRGLGALGLVATLGGPVLVLVAARRLGAWERTLAALAAIPLAAVLAGVLTFVASDYPHFLARNARSRLGLPAGPASTSR
jgi:hypothetical protein